MAVNFIWKNDPPKYPDTDVIQDGFQLALDHLEDPRNIMDKVVTAYLSLDNVKHNVIGVGWSKDDKEPLVTFRYSIINKITSCVYYES
jgi:hypothetical protein